MAEFEKEQIEALSDFLYNSHIHDALLESFQYDRAAGLLKVRAVNRIDGLYIDMTFYDVIMLLSVRGIYGNRTTDCRTILSLGIEQDYPQIAEDYPQIAEDCLKKHGKDSSNMLYMLFQMFSEDEIHVLFKKISIIQAGIDIM